MTVTIVWTLVLDKDNGIDVTVHATEEDAWETLRDECIADAADAEADGYDLRTDEGVLAWTTDVLAWGPVIDQHTVNIEFETKEV